MILRHRVRTSAGPPQVWAFLGDPSRWPEVEVLLRRVRGSAGPAAAGQQLLGVGPAGVPVPLDVVEAVPERRLVLRVHAAPGVTSRTTWSLAPEVRGGCVLTVSLVVEGLFAPGAVLPLWLSTGLTARVLARRAGQLARAGQTAA